MIKVLSEHLAALIAAGEVIDAPYSIVRECTDNSIDAGASFIIVKFNDLNNLVIEDNGCGINLADFDNIARMHSTSKISTRDDIYNINTLGFRGEALFSIASVSNLKIESNSYSLSIHENKRGKVIKSNFSKGMRITVNDLFLNLPARLNFLHSENYEQKRAKEIFFDKALCYNNITFKFYDSNNELTEWPREDDKKRIARYFNNLSFNSFSYKCDDFQLKGHYLENDYFTNKKNIHIFINGHAVDYYQLQLAIIKGLDMILPGGEYPKALLFVNIDPSLADFNINPTKRECRLRNESVVFRAVFDNVKKSVNLKIPNVELSEMQKGVEIVNNVLFSQNIPYYEKRQYGADNRAVFSKKDSQDELEFTPQKTFTEMEAYKKLYNYPYYYIGQVFNLFLVVECDDMLFFFDQHAAAERVLFEKIKDNKEIIKLLIPLEFEVTKDIDEYLIKNNVYEKFKITIRRLSPLKWVLESFPAILKTREELICDIIKSGIVDERYISTRLYASYACHNSIKAGDSLPQSVATELVKEILNLDEPVCPHGRCFVSILNKRILLENVMR